MNDLHETNVKLQNMFSGVNLFRNVGLHSKSLQCMKDRNVSVLLESDPQVLVFSSVFGLHELTLHIVQKFLLCCLFVLSSFEVDNITH